MIVNTPEREFFFFCLLAMSGNYFLCKDTKIFAQMQMIRQNYCRKVPFASFWLHVGVGMQAAEKVIDAEICEEDERESNDATNVVNRF